MIKNINESLFRYVGLPLIGATAGGISGYHYGDKEYSKLPYNTHYVDSHGNRLYRDDVTKIRAAQGANLGLLSGVGAGLVMPRKEKFRNMTNKK
jgi:hypothetical protein